MKLQSRDAKEKVSLEWRLQGESESGVASPRRRWVWSGISEEKVSLEWRFQGDGESGVASPGRRWVWSGVFKEKVSLEWRLVALSIDRLFFVVYIATIITSICAISIIVFLYSDEKQQEDKQLRQQQTTPRNVFF